MTEYGFFVPIPREERYIHMPLLLFMLLVLILEEGR